MRAVSPAADSGHPVAVSPTGRGRLTAPRIDGKEGEWGYRCREKSTRVCSVRPSQTGRARAEAGLSRSRAIGSERTFSHVSCQGRLFLEYSGPSLFVPSLSFTEGGESHEQR